MDRFQAMTVFARVARLGSFAGAAHELRLSKTAVSRLVAQLEEHLHTRLLHRTTRRLSLTDAGAAYLERCEQVLTDLRELEDAVADNQKSPAGRIRVSAGVSFAQEQLSCLLPEFVKRHPRVALELQLSDRRVDLVAEHVDLAIRIGALVESSMVARHLGVCRHAVCAAPDYLAQRGQPATPSDLAAHDCIIDTNQPRDWWFDDPSGAVSVAVSGRYLVNSAHAARDAALAGLGVAYLPTFVAGPLIENGHLVVVFGDRGLRELPLVALYPKNRYLSTGVRALVAFLRERFVGEPPWDAWRTMAA